MTGRAKPGWGGAREGAGQPKKTLTAAQTEKLVNEAVTIKKETGTSPYRLLLEYAYGVGRGEGFPPSTRAKALEKFFDLTMAKMTEGGETDHQLAPAVYLAEEKPARVIPIKGASKK